MKIIKWILLIALFKYSHEQETLSLRDVISDLKSKSNTTTTTTENPTISTSTTTENPTTTTASTTVEPKTHRKVNIHFNTELQIPLKEKPI